MTTGKPIQVGGTLSLDKLYIHRPEDDLAFTALSNGEYCNILTTRQVGKSSLVVRVRKRLAAAGVKLVGIDLAGHIGTPQNAEEWFVGFLEKVALDLRLDEDVETWWKEKAKGTYNERLHRFFREVVATSVRTAPVVVFLDEVDRVINIPYADDLFLALRAMFNDRSEVPEYKRITFCLIGAAAPQELIKDRRTTPYNIGRMIELDDFNADRDDLSELYSVVSASGASGEAIVRAILHWTGGHPFLTMVFCQLAIETGVKEPADIDGLVKDRFLDHLDPQLKTHVEWINNFLKERLRHDLTALRLYGRLLHGKSEKDRPLDTHIMLKLSGLVKRGPDGDLMVRNRLYAARFGAAWLSQTQPMRTQSLLIAIAVGAVFLAIAGVGVGIYLVRKANFEAEEARRQLAEYEENAKAALARLEESKTEAEAISEHKNVCDFLKENRSRESAKEHVDRANRLYVDFLHRRAAHFESQANELFDRLEEEIRGPQSSKQPLTDDEKKKFREKNAAREKEVEEGFLLLARAAVNRGKLSDEAKRRYHASPYAQLSATVHYGTEGGGFKRVRFVQKKHAVLLTTGKDLQLVNTPFANAKDDAAPSTDFKESRLGDVLDLDVTADGSQVVAAKEDSISLIDPITFKRTELHRTKIRTIYSISAVAKPSPSDTYLIALALGLDGARVLAADAGKDVRIDYKHEGGRAAVYSAHFSASRDLLITAADDGLARIFPISTATHSVAAPNAALRFGNRLYDAQFSNNDEYIVLSGAGGAAVYRYSDVRSTRNAKPISTLDGVKLHLAGDSKDWDFFTVAFDPEGKLVVTAVRHVGDGSGSVVVWDPQAKPEESIRLNTRLPRLQITDAAFSQDGERVVTAWDDSAIRMFDIAPLETPEDPLVLWETWQRKFGMTLDDNGEAVVRKSPSKDIKGNPGSEPCKLDL